jgi:hypothetical protein
LMLFSGEGVNSWEHIDRGCLFMGENVITLYSYFLGLGAPD